MWEVQFRHRLAMFRKNFLFEFEIGNQNRPNSRSNGSKMKQRGARHAKVGGRRKNRNLAYLKQNSEVLEVNGIVSGVSVTLPIKTISEANCFEPWYKRYGRHKDQQRVVGLSLNPLKGYLRLPCSIMLTRYAPDELDVFDNLPMSFKYIVDTVCAIITGEEKPGKADSDKRISISCGQEKSAAYGIRVEIMF